MHATSPKPFPHMVHEACHPYADMHMHLDFCNNVTAFLDGFIKNDSHEIRAYSSKTCAHIKTLSQRVLCAQTVRPSAYLPAKNMARAFLDSLGEPTSLHIITGLGFHPWWIADGTIDEDEYAYGLTCIKDASLIGEIGIDGKIAADTHDEKLEQRILEKQVRVFTEICTEAARTAGLASLPPRKKILSIHAVSYKGSVVDILSRTGALEVCTPMFHWFSLDGRELVSAIRGGCYFSVNERMCMSKRGRSYIAQIPLTHLLLETDLPRKKDDRLTTDMWRVSLEHTVQSIAHIKSMPIDDVAHLVYDNSLRVLEGA